MYTTSCDRCKGTGRIASFACGRCDGTGRMWVGTNSRRARPFHRERLERLRSAARVGALLFAGWLTTAIVAHFVLEVVR